MGSFTWVGEYNAAADPDPDTSTAVSPTPTPRRSKRHHWLKKYKFLGWGSRPLIEFLDSIGRDTSKPISPYDVASVVTDYVNKRSLLHPTKKKRIVCDQPLRSLFGRKTIARIKIYDLLQPHFADNLEDDSDDDDSNSNSSDEAVDDDVTARKRRQQKRRFDGLDAPPPKSCFAAVIPENLKLLYLRRSVVVALAMQEEEKVFEDKVVGSFVRTKSDPNDYLQKNSHQLLQVKAILRKPESSSADGGGGDGLVLLQLYGAIKDFTISMLSDDNFSKEECEYLRERIQGGVLRRPTVVEFQRKVQMLHEDVTKHWLARELTYLQNLIDRANEKGWRRELFEYLERRQLLQSPDEQARLLREVPEVIADELEVEVKDSPDNLVQKDHGSPGLLLRGVSETPLCEIPAKGSQIVWTSAGIGSEACKDDEFLQDWQKQIPESVKRILGETNNGIVEDNKASQQLMDKHVVTPEVVNLSDDESEEQRSDRKYEIPIEQLGNLVWHYVDPQGNVQGPFSIISLKRWSDLDYFDPDFKIWKTGQSSDQAVLLTHILRQNFPDRSVYQ